MSTRSGLIVALGITAAAAACGEDSIPDETAAVTVDGAAVEPLALDACGVDQDTLLIVGRDPDGAVLQIAVGVDADGDDFSVDETEIGFTLNHEAVVVGAFTPLAWELRAGSGPVPGEIISAELRGSRLTLSARAEPVDDSEAVPTEVEIDARCDGDDIA